MVDVAHAGSSLALAQPLTAYTPDNAAFNYSDYCAVAVSSAMARFTRPIVDGQGFEFCNPGARVRFVTNATLILVKLTYNNLLIRQDTYSGGGLVLVNGAQVNTFTRVQGAAGPVSFFIIFGSAVNRTIDLVMPYCAGVDFKGISITVGATLSAPAVRPVTRYVAIGDSITHGFLASDVGHEWPYLLSNADTYQLIDCGYGGRVCDATDGTVLGNLSPTLASYLIGYNNFTAQTPLATFKATYTSFINNFRAITPNVKLYCITPTYSPNTNTLTLEMYRQQIRDALTALGNVKNILVEGAALATNDVAHFPDGIHPSDSAAIQISANLQAVVVP